MNAHFRTRTACPACGGTHLRPAFARPYADPALRAALERFYAEVGRLDYAALLGADYVVSQCADCDLHFQRDIPDDFLLGQLYEEWISPELSRERFHAHLPPARQREIDRDVRASLALVTAPPGLRRALDYGCGWGEWGRTTLAFGAETWGTELSPTRREACRRDGIRVVPDAELPDGAFDLINADQVFEHLPDPAATLALLAAKLRPGGVLRLAVPNGWRIGAALKNFDRELRSPRLGALNAIAPLEHLNGFTTRSLLRLAARCGLVRVTPPWRGLVRGGFFPAGAKSALKQLARPFYLRSPWSTQLWLAAPATRRP